MTQTLAAQILVVDDHDALRFGKVQRLRRYGYRVLEAATGQDALRAVETDDVDLVLLDVNLPDISGIEVCRRLKQSARRAVQVLQLSSTAIADADRVKGLESGADAYLTEPVNVDVLVATIEALLRVRRAETALELAVARERDAREEAERASRVKDDFLATLSHELRTPLHAMVGWIWRLRHDGDDPAARSHALDGMERSTTLQVRLIDDLMDVSRIARGKLDLEVRDVDVDAVIRGAIDVVQTNIAAKHLKLALRTVPVTLNADPNRLHQIVLNLLTNAVQFSTRDGELEVATDVADGVVTIRVRDTGAGIPPDLLPHIFEQFRQGQSGPTRRHGGLGLGLAIVRELVALHGGTVEAESPGPDLGATFTVRLPIAGPAAGTAAHPSLEGRRVLVVDDDPDSRMWMKALVESAGGAAVTASSARIALGLLASEPFDLVVSDIGMPDWDGFDLIRLMREQDYRMPCIAVTAFSSQADTRRILTSGFARHVGKPLRPREFLLMIAEEAARADGPSGLTSAAGA